MTCEALRSWPVVLRNANLPMRQILHLGNKVSFTRGSKVGVEDAPSGVFYFLQKGSIRLSSPVATGGEKILYYIGENTIFNELPALTNGKLYISTCLERVEAIAIDIELIRSQKILHQYPDVILNMLDSLSQKTLMLYHQASMGAYPAFTNVCRLLYSMCLHNKKGSKIVPYLSKQDFASMLSIHRGSLHKCLARLRTEGIIEGYSRRELIVHDMETLRQYAFADMR